MSGRLLPVMPIVAVIGMDSLVTGPRFKMSHHWTESLVMPRNYECLTGVQVSQFCVSGVNNGNVFREMGHSSVTTQFHGILCLLRI